MKKLGIIPFAIGIIFILTQCEAPKTEFVKMAFYNVENLFDTIDSPDTEDSEFLPESRLNWDTEKMNQKIENISKVLLSIDLKSPPAIIGLCEVENLFILNALIENSDLKKYNYKTIHKESPDFRGIDVAIIYRPDQYKPIKNEWIKIEFPFDEGYTTRDILYSKGLLANNDTLHIFTNHWTSRWGGQEVTEAKRIYLAELTKLKTNQILARNPNANIIIMGDLNDNPTDKSLLEGLEAASIADELNSNALYNLSLDKYLNGEGTLFWKTWDLFDQMIVSGNLVKEGSSTKLVGNTHYIFKEDWMLFTDNDGNHRPSRSASSGKYYGGYSDHLPVWLELKLNMN